MYTQCSNCKTLFRITEEQLELVGGKVRCGFCYNTFNAYEALYEDLPSETVDEENEEEFEEWEVDGEPVALDEVEPAVETQVVPETFDTPSLPQDLAQEYAAEGVRVNARHIIIPTATPPPPPRPLPPVNRVNTPGLRTPPPAAPPPPAYEPPPPMPRARPVQQPTPPPPEPARRPPIFEPANPLPAPAPSPQPPPVSRSAAPAMPRFDNAIPAMPKEEPGGQLPNLFDSIDLAGRELQQVTRFELDRRRGGYDGSDTLATLGWGIATLVLVSAILFQIAYFARDELARHAPLRPWLERMCELAGCKLALMRNVTLIKLVSRDIRVHPKIRDALEVRATFVNDAPFSQPYPVLRLDLMDAGGNRVATRQFEPSEYLTNPDDVDVGIAPQQQVDVKLEIMDAEQKAHGFEFSFL